MRKKIYTKEKLQEAIDNSKCFADVCRFLGARTSGNTYQRIKWLIKDLGLNTSHFYSPKMAGLMKAKIAEKKAWQDILLDKVDYKLRSKTIRRALLDSGREYICELCGQIPFWNNRELTLQVDHINGDNCRCNPENLRFLCPNCHVQETDVNSTYNKCKNCLCKITSKSKYCKRCYGLFFKPKRKVENRPSIEVLIKEVEEFGYLGTGKKYGVSDNTVRKWIKKSV